MMLLSTLFYALYSSEVVSCSQYYHGRTTIEPTFRKWRSVNNHGAISLSLSVLSSVRGGSSTTPNVSNARHRSSLNIFSRGGSTEKNTSVGTLKALRSLGIGALAGIVSWQFALAFPFLITPKAAKEAYIPAHFSYNAQDSHFCESAWTTYTDYGLGVVMTYLAIKIFKSMPSSTNDNRNTSVRRLRNLSTVLMSFYAVQFSVAGVLHQFLGSLDARNTLLFRFFWTIVTTMVSASGGAIGAIGCELARESLGLSRNIVPGDLFWIGYTVIIVAITIGGFISYQRPAADTFIAGTSQGLSTIFIIGIVFFMGGMGKKLGIVASNDELSIPDQLRCILGFLMNSFLLPGYALTLYLTDTSIPTINTVMHSWLCLCYTLQGLSLSKIVKLAAAREQRQHKQSLLTSVSAGSIN